MWLDPVLRSIHCLVAPICPSHPLHISWNSDRISMIFGAALCLPRRFRRLPSTIERHLPNRNFFCFLYSTRMSDTFVKVSLIYYGYCDPSPLLNLIQSPGWVKGEYVGWGSKVKCNTQPKPRVKVIEVRVTAVLYSSSKGYTCIYCKFVSFSLVKSNYGL